MFCDQVDRDASNTPGFVQEVINTMVFIACVGFIW